PPRACIAGSSADPYAPSRSATAEHPRPAPKDASRTNDEVYDTLPASLTPLAAPQLEPPAATPSRPGDDGAERPPRPPPSATTETRSATANRGRHSGVSGSALLPASSSARRAACPHRIARARVSDAC